MYLQVPIAFFLLCVASQSCFGIPGPAIKTSIPLKFFKDDFKEMLTTEIPQYYTTKDPTQVFQGDKTKGQIALDNDCLLAMKRSSMEPGDHGVTIDQVINSQEIGVSFTGITFRDGFFYVNGRKMSEDEVEKLYVNVPPSLESNAYRVVQYATFETFERVLWNVYESVLDPILSTFKTIKINSFLTFNTDFVINDIVIEKKTGEGDVWHFNFGNLHVVHVDGAKHTATESTSQWNYSVVSNTAHFRRLNEEFSKNPFAVRLEPKKNFVSSAFDQNVCKDGGWVIHVALLRSAIEQGPKPIVFPCYPLLRDGILL